LDGFLIHIPNTPITLHARNFSGIKIVDYDELFGFNTKNIIIYQCTFMVKDWSMLFEQLFLK